VQDFERAAALAGALQSHLRDISFPLAPAIERDIQREVWDYADELKGLGLPPERVIIAVKRAANEAGLYSTHRVVATPSDLDDGDKLLVDMVGWCIERYYGPPPRAD
jgi:hypothetical protein